MGSFHVGLTIAMAVLGAGCFSVNHQPPPVAPARLVPALDLGGAPGPGLGRVLLDVEGDQATVYQVAGASVAGGAFAGSFEVSRPLCVTPCRVDLAPGPVALRFVSRVDSDRHGDGFINVDQSTSVYRYRLGRSRRPYLRRSLAWLTGAVGVFCDVGAIATIGHDDVKVPITYGVIGAAFTGLSWWLFRTSGFVEQNGAGTQWALDPSAR